MLNPYILFQKSNPTSKLRFANFQVTAIKSMITPYNRALSSAAATDKCVKRLTERHFLGHTSPKAESAKKNFISPRCRVWFQKPIRKEVTHISSGCPSHPAPCFELYHAKLNYWD